MSFDTSYILNKKLPAELTGTNLPANERRITVLSDLIPVTIPTYYDPVATGYQANQVVHPSILYFDNGFNGYKYWMGFTPYPNSKDIYENPSIVVSNDGDNWTVPKGLTNPLALPDEGAGSHLADTELVYDSDNKQLILYWIQGRVGNEPVKIRFRKSSNGINWGPTTQCTFPGEAPIAPVIERISSSSWRMWGNPADNTHKIALYTSFDGINWKLFHMIDSVGMKDGKYSLGEPGRTQPWHPGVFIDDTGYHFLVSTKGEGVKNQTGEDLYYGYSKDGFFIEYEPQPIITPKKGSLIEATRYRSCITRTHTGGHRLYVSGRNHAGLWGIGYYEIRFNNSALLHNTMNLPNTILSHESTVKTVDVSSKVILSEKGASCIPFQGYNYVDIFLYVSDVGNFEANGKITVSGSMVPETDLLSEAVVVASRVTITPAKMVKDAVSNYFHIENVPVAGNYLKISVSNTSPTATFKINNWLIKRKIRK